MEGKAKIAEKNVKNLKIVAEEKCCIYQYKLPTDMFRSVAGIYKCFIIYNGNLEMKLDQDLDGCREFFMKKMLIFPEGYAKLLNKMF